VKKAHPNAKTSLSSVAWYRNNLRKKVKSIKTNAQVVKARAKAAA